MIEMPTAIGIRLSCGTAYNKPIWAELDTTGKVRVYICGDHGGPEIASLNAEDIRELHTIVSRLEDIAVVWRRGLVHA